MRDHPAVIWLVLAVIVAALHDVVAHSTWLLIHLVMLGAVTHAILVWSAYFTQALLKTPDSIDDRRQQSRRLALLVVGTTFVLVGVPTTLWPLTVAGASAVAAAVVWHGIQLVRRLRRALPSRFRVTVHYYLVAGGWLVTGATLGAIMAREPGETWMGRLIVAHTMALGLGWVGLTVTGTLVTLWPTMLRTRMDDRAEGFARRALPVFVVALTVVVLGAVAGVRWAVVAGLVLYAVALAWWGRALVIPARARPPHQFSTLSLTAGLTWFALLVPAVIVAVLRMPDWAHLEDVYHAPATIVVGGVVQILIGALSYLVPTVIGGGPSVVRAAHLRFDRYAVLRVVVVNAGLVGLVLPTPSSVQAACFGLAVVGLAAFVPLLVWAVAGTAAARQALEDRIDLPAGAGAREGAPAILPVWSRGQLVAGLAIVAVFVAVAVVAGQ